MRPARNLLLAAIGVLSVTVVLAPSASASFPQPNVEVKSETADPEVHCPAVTAGANHTVSGGCAVHASTDPLILATTFAHTGASEFITSLCANEFTARIDEGGNGYISVTDASIATNGATCGITPCDEAGNPPHAEYEWPIRLVESTTTSEQLIVTFCIRAAHLGEGTVGNNCTVAIPWTQELVAHRLRFTASFLRCLENPSISISGTWIAETTPNIPAGEVTIEVLH